ncbi:MAG TPA: SDR family NAD(P)-dependent oxidoreductase, partial [Pyrinomonadaceae bacterium]|nr:SDR family NAD(P)-dependent oxidoreductase [Pyrinomonadaceae bacterium]
MTDTSEQVALVTGANRGIGLEVTRQLAALGFNVILGSRAPAKGEEAARRMVADGLKVIPRRLDVTDQKSINELKSWVEERFGGLDVLVNNAAILYDSWQR